MQRKALEASRWFFVVAAGLSFVGSVSCWFLVDREVGLFIGIWVPSILSLGTLLQFHGGGSGR